MSPVYAMKCTDCDRKSEIMTTGDPETEAALCPCGSERVRDWVAPSIGRGSSGEPFRPGK